LREHVDRILQAAFGGNEGEWDGSRECVSHTLH
jgi:hypothetical protein